MKTGFASVMGAWIEAPKSATVTHVNTHKIPDVAIKNGDTLTMLINSNGEVEIEVAPDMVNHPPHYTFSKFEPADVIRAWDLNFFLGNAVKYIARHAHKKNALEDLKKARWYLDNQIKAMEAYAEQNKS